MEDNEKTKEIPVDQETVVEPTEFLREIQGKRYWVVKLFLNAQEYNQLRYSAGDFNYERCGPFLRAHVLPTWYALESARRKNIRPPIGPDYLL